METFQEVHQYYVYQSFTTFYSRIILKAHIYRRFVSNGKNPICQILEKLQKFCFKNPVKYLRQRVLRKQLTAFTLQLSSQNVSSQTFDRDLNTSKETVWKVSITLCIYQEYEKVQKREDLKLSNVLEHFILFF